MQSSSACPRSVARAFVATAVMIAAAAGGVCRAQTAPGWLDPAWTHRRQVMITNPNGSALFEFQVRIALNSEFDFESAKPAGDDLRVTAGDGTTAIPFWIENWSASAREAVVWVRVGSIPVAGAAIYLYYGNPAAGTASDGNLVFEFFDDFETPYGVPAAYWSLSAPATVLADPQVWETTPPHSLSVVEANRNGYRYWGYYGLQACGGVGLAFSNDLSTWIKHEANPIIPGGRWPSVLLVDGTYYMAYTQNFCAGGSYITLATSPDGITFTDQGTLAGSEEGMRNQNPNLFRGPDGTYFLYWYRGNDSNLFEIRAKSASSIAGLLSAATSTVVLSSSSTMAAPNMLYRDNTYYLAIETGDSSGQWSVRVSTSTSPVSGFQELPSNPVLSGGAACLSQHIFDNTLHDFYCQLTGLTWTLEHRTADLSLALPQAPDPAKWIASGGDWTVTSGTSVYGTSGHVLEGRTSTRQILYSTYSGTDYIAEADGEQIGGRVWGLGIRASGIGNLYSFNLYEDLDYTQNLHAYSWVNNTGPDATSVLGSAAVGTITPGTWYALSVRAGGSSFDVYKDGVLTLQTGDSSLPSGGVALYGERNSIVRFDNVKVRKSAPFDPATAVGAGEILAAVSVRLNPAVVTGGGTSQGTVTLTLPAPSGGATAMLSSSNAGVAAVPNSVSVGAGLTSAVFEVTTTAVPAITTAVITAAYGGRNATAELTIDPPSLSALALDPATVISGASSVGTVTLTGVAPAGGAVVALASSDASAALTPANVTVQPGVSSATFTVLTSATAAAGTVTISAAYGGGSASAALTIQRPAPKLAGISLTPANIVGGNVAGGSVTLTAAAPQGGAIVALSSSDASVAAVPSSITIRAGLTSATFSVTTSGVAASTGVQISASYSGDTLSATLNVNPASLSSLTLSPASVKGGTASAGVIALNGRAPSGGLTVAVASSNPYVASVPPSVTIQAGAASATFQITTRRVTANTKVQITATLAGISKAAVLNIRR